MTSPENPLYYAALWPQQVCSASGFAWTAPSVQSLPVAVCTINYQAAELTEGCLAALAKLQIPPAWVVVVDNGPGLADFERLSALATQSSWPFYLLVLRSPFNGGFSAANNLAIRYLVHQLAQVGILPPKAFWILNNDTQPEPEALAALWSAFQHHPDSILGSRLFDFKGQFETLGNRIKQKTASLVGYPNPPETQTELYAIDALSGASMFIPFQVIQTVGLWDTPYFLYWEDPAFCFKARAAGFKILSVPGSKVRHVNGGTMGAIPARRYFYYLRNRLFFAAQCLSPSEQVTCYLYQGWRWFRFILSFLAAMLTNRRCPKTRWQDFSICHAATSAIVQKQWGACPANI